MKKSKKDINYRRDKIHENLGKNGYRKVEDLAAECGVSLVTVRRDLLYLEKQNLITRFHGGAQLTSHTPVQPEEGRDLSMIDRLAENAVPMVEDGDTIFSNSGMTTYAVLQKIHKEIVAVTSNVYAMQLDPPDSPMTLIFTGGEIARERDSFVGQFSISLIDMVTANKWFLGVNAISADSGLTSSSMQKIAINIRMLERCHGPKIVVAEGYKIGKTTNFHVCPITKITHLITDASADPQELQKIRRAGVEVIVI